MAKLPADCMPRCADCAFIEIGPKEDDGFCRRHPPRVIIINDEAFSTLPIVDRKEWCGEFVRRSN